MVSAPWLSDNRASIEIVASKIQQSLTDSEFLQLARVVILETNDPVVAFLQGEASVTNGHYKELPGGSFTDRFGFSIKKAFLLRCQTLEDIQKAT